MMVAAETHASAARAVLADFGEGLLRITLNSPERCNVLSQSVLGMLQEEIDLAANNENVGVIIINAHGPVFSSGHDLREMRFHRKERDGGRAYFTELMAQSSRLMQSIASLAKPVIAEVQGLASAAGCQLAASCDLIIAAHSARFCTPGVEIGLFCTTPMVALTRAIGSRHAMEMLLTGDEISAETAMRFGLVNRVVEDNRLAEETERLARQILSKSAQAIAFGKRAFVAQQRMALDHAYALCSKVMVDNLMADEAKEGIDAFLDKRTPRWTGRR